jgi:hypothetical protein
MVLVLLGLIVAVAGQTTTGPPGGGSNDGDGPTINISDDVVLIARGYRKINQWTPGLSSPEDQDQIGDLSSLLNGGPPTSTAKLPDYQINELMAAAVKTADGDNVFMFRSPDSAVNYFVKTHRPYVDTAFAFNFADAATKQAVSDLAIADLDIEDLEWNDLRVIPASRRGPATYLLDTFSINSDLKLQSMVHGILRSFL